MQIRWPILHFATPGILPSTWRNPNIPRNGFGAGIKNGRNKDVVKEHELVVGLAGLPVFWPVKVAPRHKREARLGGPLATGDDHRHEHVAVHDVVAHDALPPVPVDPRLVRSPVEAQDRAERAHLGLAQKLDRRGEPAVAATVGMNVGLEVVDSSVHHRLQIVVHGCEVAVPPNRVAVVCRVLGHQHWIERRRYGAFDERVSGDIVPTDLIVRSLH
mmetsp:Transcript_12788/g.34824  ORF Transcript_12788/g.34824 Transcript_12788/m.34824 type:complete len:216 (+) Transcript_12788:450-1097(+)